MIGDLNIKETELRGIPVASNVKKILELVFVIPSKWSFCILTLSIARLISVSISSKTLVPSKAILLNPLSSFPFHLI
jgi:hypothetical protein